jgi:transcriptional regulator with XRE-family HTH domain
MSALNQLERGKRPDPRLSTLTALAAALRVAIDQLAGRSGADRPRQRRRPVEHSWRPVTEKDLQEMAAAAFDPTTLE